MYVYYIRRGYRIVSETQLLSYEDLTLVGKKFHEFDSN